MTKTFGFFFIGSAIVALASCVLTIGSMPRYGFYKYIHGYEGESLVMFCLGGLWIALFASGLYLYGKKTFWLLVTAPFALLGPLFLIYLYLICWLDIGCL